MAKIPTYTSRSSAVTTSGINRATGIPFRDFEGDALIETGKMIGGIADQMLKAAEDDAVGQAKLNATLKINELQMELQTTDPMAAMSEYDTRAQQIMNEASSGLSMNAAARFKSDITNTYASGKIAVQKDSIRRGRQDLESKLVTRMAGLAKSIRADDQDRQYSNRADEAQDAIAEAVANRVIAADMGARIYQKYLNDADNARASFDMQKDPDKFMEDMEGKEKFVHLTGEQRGQWRTKAEALIKRRQKEEKAVRDAAEKIAVDKINKGIKILDGGAELNSRLEALFNPDRIRRQITDPVKAEKIIALTNDAVVFYKVRNNLGELDTPALMELAERFVSEAKDDVEDADLRIQNQKQRDIISGEIEKRVDARGKAHLKKVKDALTAEANLQPREPLPKKFRDVLTLSSTIANVGGDENVSDVHKMIVDQRAFNIVIKNLGQLSNLEILEEVEGARVELSQADPFSQTREQKQVDALQKEAKKILELRAKDPVRSVMSSSSIADAYNRFQKNPTAENYTDYAAKRDNEMKRLGIPFYGQKLLSNAEAKQQTNIFNSLVRQSPEDAADQMESLQETYGDDWPRILNEMHAQGLREDAAVLMHVDDKNLRDQLAIIVSNGGLSALRADTPTITMKGFNSTLGLKMASLEKAAKGKGRLMTRSVRNAVEMLARSRIQDSTYKTVDEAINGAYDEVVGKNYHIVDHDYLYGVIPIVDHDYLYGVIPKQDPDFENQVSRIILGLKNWFNLNQDITFAPVHLKEQMRVGMTPKEIKEQTFELIQSNATWQLSPDGSEAILNYQNRPIADGDNNVISVSLDSALAFSFKFQKNPQDHQASLIQFLMPD